MFKRLMLLSVVVGAVLPKHALAQDEPTPEATVRMFHEALATGDSVTALSLLTEDAVIYESGGMEASREEYRSHHLSADIEFASSTVPESTLDRSGRSGDIAWVLSRSRTIGTFRDSEIDSMGTETMLLVHTAGGWRIRHIHWSSRRAPRPEGR
jgi:ketosteroid isomerase-like protein